MTFNNIILVTISCIFCCMFLCGCDSDYEGHSSNAYIQESPYERTDRLILETQEALRQVPDYVHGVTERRFRRLERGVSHVGDMTQAEYMQKIRESARKNKSYWEW